MQSTVSRRLILLILPLLITVSGLWAQDTRGGLTPDTKVTLADGRTVAVQDLTSGASLISYDASGKATEVRLSGIRKQHTDSYLKIRSETGELLVTGSQRVLLAKGGFARADVLKAGDLLTVLSPRGPVETKVSSIRIYPSNLVVYDLTVDGHGVFVASGFLVLD